MMSNIEQPKFAVQTDKYCPFLKQSCINEDCELYIFKLGHCSLNILPFNLYQVNNTIEKAVRKISVYVSDIKGERPLFAKRLDKNYEDFTK
jgi:hypothetical protein